MPKDYEPDQIQTIALNLIRSGEVGGDTVNKSSQVGQPLAVQGPNRKIHSWFVPVTMGSHLTGFFQFLADGTFMRFSTFQRRAGEPTGYPAAADWLDPKVIQTRAQTLCRTNETSGTPYLTYDRSPDRLVWAVPLTNADGQVRHVYVTGGTVYMPPPSETYG